MEFGSVRFFKRVILITLALLIAVPTTLCIVFAAQKSKLGNRIAGAEEQVDAANVELSSLQDRLEVLEKPLKTPDTGGDGSPVPALELAQQAGVELPEYSALYPEMYVETEDRGTQSTPNTCYLTFDDGPSACTDDILDILKELGVKATFFVVPRSDDATVARMKRIVEEGHTIGIHTASHEYGKIYASLEAYLEDFYKAFCIIKDATGQAPEVWRFPGGSINGYNMGFYQQAIAELGRRGFSYFDWNACGEDAVSGKTTAASIVKYSLDSGLTHKRAILLLHDAGDKQTTVAALRDIISGYWEAGYSFDRLTPQVVPIVYSYRD